MYMYTLGKYLSIYAHIGITVSHNLNKQIDHVIICQIYINHVNPE